MTTAQQLREALGKLPGEEWYDDTHEENYSEMGEYAVRDVHEGIFWIDENGETLNVMIGDNEETDAALITIRNLLPTLLDEYEKLEQKVRVLNGTLVLTDLQLKDAEREAAVGRALAEAVGKMDEKGLEPYPYRDSAIERKVMTEHWHKQRDSALSAYHTACGKGDV